MYPSASVKCSLTITDGYLILNGALLKHTMKKISPAAAIILLTVSLQSQSTTGTALVIPYDVIEDFDDGTVELLSYPGQDSQPDAWELDP